MRTTTQHREIPAGFGRGGFQGVAGRVAHPVTLVISAMRQPSAARPSGLVPSLTTSLTSGDMCPVATDRTLAIDPRISAVMSIVCLSSLVSGQRSPIETVFQRCHAAAGCSAVVFS